ncbi:MAG: alpha/beta hydrolase [Alphaproteobacteria bacterium]|nr:MAG: alpha/beta hydrolase [Alphaproteobacteria bacterium]
MDVGARTNPFLCRRTIVMAAGGLVAMLGGGCAHTKPVSKKPWDTKLPSAWHDAPTIPLWPDGTPTHGFQNKTLSANHPEIFVRNIAKPELRVFRPQVSNGRSLLTIPGGSYTFISIQNEGYEIAQRMTALGYTVFVLNYRLPGEGWINREDVPLQDAQRAVRVIRRKGSTYGVDSKQLIVVGFSAGGHLAATLATSFAEQTFPARDSIDAIDARPNAVGLIYPVISLAPSIGHHESTLQLLGPYPSAELINRRSPALHVTNKTPPVFLVHALNDIAVTPENSLMMMKALQAVGQPVEGHFFTEGSHGFGPGKQGTPAGQWMSLFDAWIDRQMEN